jgi:CRISPR system Cascade subunit CasD
LGIERDESSKLRKMHEGLRLACRVDSSGTLEKDYQTRQSVSLTENQFEEDSQHFQRRKRFFSEDRHGLKQKGATVDINTKTDEVWYVCDGVYSVAVSRRSNVNCPSLSNLKEALCQPHFHLYMGRKSCPLGKPPNPEIVSKDNFLSALEEVEPFRELKGMSNSDEDLETFSKRFRDSSQGSLFCWEDEDLDFDEIWKTSRLDRAIDPTGRKFIHRKENRTYIDGGY